jgi:hypothetical protein
MRIRRAALTDMFIFITVFTLGSAVFAISSYTFERVSFTERAQGGTLSIIQSSADIPRHATIKTHEGDSNKDVLRRLYSVVEKQWQLSGGGVLQDDAIELGGLTSGNYAIAGTDRGLGVPGAPRNLTLQYESNSHSISARWQNCEDYTLLRTVLGPLVANELDGKAEHANRLLRPEVSIEGLRFGLVAKQDDTPSGLAVMRMMGPNAQEELFVVPFHMGIQPNWAGWQAPGDAEKVTLAEGIKPDLADEAVAREKWYAHEHPDNKRYYQLIKAQDGGVGGVYRKFLGLEPGTTYRVVTRMNTLDMDKAEGDWRFSFHALPHAYATELTREQMAGAAPLPDGASGADAALVAAFTPGDTTGGKYVEASTEHPEGADLAQDITLGPDDDTITVWFRYTAEHEDTGVGTDWIRLEKLSDGHVAAPSAEQGE